MPDNPYINLARGLIETIDRDIAHWRKQRELLVQDMQSMCEHTSQTDRTETRGQHCDNGYGKWWRAPYFECDECGAVSTDFEGFRTVC